ncbi:MAG: hypothetical protein FJ340_07535 [Sphingomonadales bacterium]|nr:hypothetical protein [Sphingomonadales bacterium]
MFLSDFLIWISLLLVVMGFSLYVYFSFFSKLFFQHKTKTTPERASTFGEFINGLTGPIFALSGFLIIYATIIDQNKINNIQKFENLFFKQLDYNRDNNLQITIKSPKSCEEISGGAAWVSFYSQLKKAYTIIQEDTILRMLPKNKIIDLSFATFYYGISKLDTTRLYLHFDKLNLTENEKYSYVSKLKLAPHCKEQSSYFIGQGNKLGAFLRQYFSFINYIDKQRFLSTAQKKEYVEMLILQNYNFCQLVIYYYLQSSFQQPDDINLANKYNLFPKLDESLLFHLKDTQGE